MSNNWIMKRGAYAVHEGGTKFYEVYWLHNDEDGGFIVKRYGPIDKMDGGGTYIIEMGNASSYNEAIRAKVGRGYTFNSAPSLRVGNLAGIDNDTPIGGQAIRRHYEYANPKKGYRRAEDIFVGAGLQAAPKAKPAVKNTPVQATDVEGWGDW